MDIPSAYDHPQQPSTTEIENEQIAGTETETGSTQTITDLSPETTTTTTATTSESTTLDQEIIDLKKTLGGVGASLGGWWGKVQKQSAEALAATNITAQINTARKDLASLNLIEKAKKEVERLGDQAKEGYAVISSEIEKGPDLDSNQDRIVNVDGVELPAPSRAISSSSIATTSTATKDNEAPTSSPKGKERALNQNQPSDHGSPNPLSAFVDPSSIGSFFSKLSKDSESLTASIQNKISHLPNQVQVPVGKFDLSEVTKLAEGYLAKGEVYLQDVGKELKEFVQDAVKVIPPSEAEQQLQGGGDGDDNITEEAGRSTPSAQPGVSLAEKRRLLDVKREAMVSRLRRDESLLLADPAQEEESIINAFDEFVSGIQQAGGFDGQAWQKRIQTELELEDSDQSPLKGLLEKLVPSSMPAQTFWTRYFFRIHRIDQEEAARRVVLSAAQEDNEGDFSWDMEDESEPTSPTVLVKTAGKEGTSNPGKEDQVETPKLSKLSNPTMDDPLSTTKNQEKGSVVEDDWGNSPIDQNTEISPSTIKPIITSSTSAVGPTHPKSVTSTSSTVDQIRRNSASEPDTNDSFDVVSAQQSSDEKSKKSADDHHKNDDDDDEDSDWE
ncbi:hypothetical protein MJO28_005832 [Puccinia striiformis f. sp. tritici]|uniref:BSD domain-containing protein n=2 Tax=Puccinia striiformis f. sp. tritici TaxID=168172 RepID=A0A0L0V5A3_9BASI|nr:hypothetical protein Pst134EA_011049 [Puccinia striiformis f. sp. tritici]KAI9627415.1 hypothetical protein H4Q26_017412 [Puccinia striiformis f. sp. tritici PST-130]KNE94386.1 hypothetical protein PSTG_12286 [Puccinia striiformis f. sp. tritici PST-78]KAH9455799.1 hypothetical protein Pst134EB_012035 [Puccinia striiformis f. sp. tritici]KAH9467403.1 hypothetical protein Pst134EA_011049 [Puccinia striiformis f. sp. tritici]KAI7953285.1 hypothetical protein MJO28_005832 [Puccinia striiformis